METLPLSFEIAYFDYYHPSPGDPGAFIKVQAHGDSYLTVWGTHGYGSRWEETSKNDVIEDIFKNRSHNDGSIHEDYQLEITRIWEIAQKGDRF